MNTKNTALSANSALVPITSNALSRQAKRLKSGLDSLIKNPPEAITLSFAQEFLAQNVWGRDSWTLIKTTEQEPPAASSLSMPEVKKPVLERIGKARAKSLLNVLITGEVTGPNQKQAVTLANIIVDLEYEKVLLYALNIQHKSLSVNFPDNIWAKYLKSPPFSLDSMLFWFVPENLEAVAWTHPDAFEDFKVNKNSYDLRKLQDFLLNMPFYNREKVGKKGGQGEDTKNHLNLCTQLIRDAIYLINEIETKNPCMWNYNWVYPGENVKYLWPLRKNSWLIDVGRESHYFEDAASSFERSYYATDALEYISYGIQSELSKFIFKWLMNVELIEVMFEDLSRYANKYIDDKRIEHGLPPIKW